MTIEEIALVVIGACENVGVDHMVTGAFAYNCFGIPRSTKDFDVVVDLRAGRKISEIIHLLDEVIEFGDQVQFDTLTWGRRHIGKARQGPVFIVELFELFEDAFVIEQFRRRKQMHSAQLRHNVWLPTAEDIVVQKIRWGRSKDLDDARDVLAVQGVETLDMPYIENWCAAHGTSERLREIIESLPEF